MKCLFTCLSAKCCSIVLINAPGYDPTSNIDDWEDFFGMFLDDGNDLKNESINRSWWLQRHINLHP